MALWDSTAFTAYTVYRCVTCMYVHILLSVKRVAMIMAILLFGPRSKTLDWME